MNYISHYQKDAEEFDYFEERRGATEHDERRLRDYVISEIPDQYNLILDAGCGSAWVAEKLLSENKTVISMDISLANVIKAKSKYSSANHYCIVGDSLYPPFKNKSVDCIIASEVIEHVTEPKMFIEKLLDKVKSNGILIISCPYKEVIRYVLCVHCNQKTPIHSHMHSFDECKLKALHPSKEDYKFEVKIFGNKYLIYLHTYIILKYLPFILWKYVDKVFNFVLGKPVHIIAKYRP